MALQTIDRFSHSNGAAQSVSVAATSHVLAHTSKPPVLSESQLLQLIKDNQSRFPAGGDGHGEHVHRVKAPDSNVSEVKATSATGTSRAALYSREGDGCYRLHQQHLSQTVRAYHLPGSQGYHHEVQEKAYCGLHILNQMLMCYSGNKYNLLASRQALHAHIEAKAQGEAYASPERRAESVRQRQRRYEFPDLASFSAAQPHGPAFDSVIGANYSTGPDRAHNPIVLPPGSPVTIADLKDMPGIGVTYRHATARGSAEHSVQILRLRGDQGQDVFYEIDPQRNPYKGKPPRRLHGDTMEAALEYLLEHHAVDTVIGGHNRGRNFDLLVPTAATLVAHRALNRPLPRLQQPTPLPPQPKRIGGPGAPRPLSPDTEYNDKRPGVEKAEMAWLAPFLRLNQVPDDVQDKLLLAPPGVSLVRHYAEVLWNHYDVRAHALHYADGEDEALRAFAQRFKGNELLVTYTVATDDSDDADAEPDEVTVLLVREDIRWKEIDAEGQRTQIEGSLWQWFQCARAECDADGLRLLRRLPSGESPMLR